MTNEHPWKTQSGIINPEVTEAFKNLKAAGTSPIKSYNFSTSAMANQIPKRNGYSTYKKACAMYRELFPAKEIKPEAPPEHKIAVDEICKIFQIDPKAYAELEKNFADFGKMAREAEAEIVKGISEHMDNMVLAEYPHLFKKEYWNGIQAGLFAAAIIATAFILILDSLPGVSFCK